MNPSYADFFISFVVASFTSLVTLRSRCSCASIAYMVLLLVARSMCLFPLFSRSMHCVSVSVGVYVDDSSLECWSSLRTGSLGASTGVSFKTSTILTSSHHSTRQLLIIASRLALVTLYLIVVHFLAGSHHA